jgi:ABC-type uncharacterized transport system permease subunit
MLSGVWISFVLTCYGVALVLEIQGPKRRWINVRAALIALMSAGIVAQMCDLARHAALVDAPPLSSPAEWLCMLAAALAVINLAAIFYLPSTPAGVFILPVVMLLTIASGTASHEPFSLARTSLVWGAIHGFALLFGTVAVCVGFWAGLMYLIQSYALKHSQSPAARFRLPSLEWLERVNSRALGLSTLLIAIGFGSGVVLSAITHRGIAEHSLFADPVVISSSAMLVWLVAAEIFRWAYPAARQGRKVAYLTLASFVFLVVMVVSFALVDTAHGGGPGPSASNQQSSAASS